MQTKRRKSEDAPETGALDEHFPRSPNPKDSEGFKESAPSYEEPTVSATVNGEQPKKRRRKILLFWLFIALATLLILGIALGVGLGVGLTNRSKSKSEYETIVTAERIVRGLMVFQHILIA